MFRARIKDSSIDFNSPAAAIRFQEWKAMHEGRRITIELEKEDRSTSQLRFYWAWLSNVAAHTGNDENELHEFLLDKCAPRIVSKIAGPKGTAEVEQTKRTSGGHRLSMSKDEMAAYMERCAQLTGYPLPTEEDLMKLGYMPH